MEGERGGIVGKPEVSDCFFSVSDRRCLTCTNRNSLGEKGSGLGVRGKAKLLGTSKRKRDKRLE